MSIEFVSAISVATWILTNIYAPCTPEGRDEFLEWFSNIDMPEGTHWLIIGDFNLIRRQTDRNKPGGNIQDMINFNAAISNLGVEELKLYGNRYIWTNKQESPLLKRLDWVFASTTWVTNYPGSSIQNLSRDILDHSPYLVTISTDIPKNNGFQI
jgi:exonuclease III